MFCANCGAVRKSRMEQNFVRLVVNRVQQEKR